MPRALWGSSVERARWVVVLLGSWLGCLVCTPAFAERVPSLVVIVGMDPAGALREPLIIQLQALGYAAQYGTWDGVLEGAYPRAIVVRLLPGAQWVELWSLDRAQGALERTIVQRLPSGDSARVQALKIVEMLRADERRQQAAESPPESTTPVPVVQNDLEEHGRAEPVGARAGISPVTGVALTDDGGVVPTVGAWGGVSAGHWSFGSVFRFGFAGELTSGQATTARELSLDAAIHYHFHLAAETLFGLGAELGGMVALVHANESGDERSTVAFMPTVGPALSFRQAVLGDAVSLVAKVRGVVLLQRGVVLAESTPLYDSDRLRLGGELGLLFELP